MNSLRVVLQKELRQPLHIEEFLLSTLVVLLLVNAVFFLVGLEVLEG